MVLTEMFMTNNPCYKTEHKITPKGIMLNSVGCPQPSAKVFVHNWNRPSCETKCPHAFIDANNGEVIQTLPWNHEGRHSGRHAVTKASANQTHIGISLCEPSQLKYKKTNVIELGGNSDMAINSVKRTYQSAVELCAKLCLQFTLNPETDIISHKEGIAQGIACKRSDVTDVWAAVGLDFTMDKFRHDVRLEMDRIAPPMSVEPKVPVMVQKVEPKPIAEPKPEPIIEPKHEPVIEPEPIVEPEPEKPKEWLIKISVENLRVRSGPGTENAPTGKYTGRGVFAITEIQNGTGSKAGWGKLRNGEGWVSLDYVEML